MELWQATHDDVVSHYKSYYNCCNAFWFSPPQCINQPTTRLTD